MPVKDDSKIKLINKLKELFQLDKPDLDFGFYRIMHAKADQVVKFIDKDLLEEIESAFGKVDETHKKQLEAQYQHELAMAKEYGVAKPEESPKVKQAKAELDKLTTNNNQQAEVYDHLYRFFERYYDKGDFISLRYLVKENSTKAAPYAIPYNGEEVKLHWANADQYYIKTSESFNNFSFDISQAKELKINDEGQTSFIHKEQESKNQELKIHFRIIDTNEGEHNNVKLANEQKRFFKLYENKPVELNNQGELVVNFEYKPTASGDNKVDASTEKLLKDNYGKSLNKNDMPNLAMAATIIAAVTKLGDLTDYLTAIQHLAPTEKIKNRPLIVKYINQYTAKNTMDYFIHKDLGGFLARELDFYLKNEVMDLDNIADANAEDVTNYLDKLKVIRKIGTKLIAFLAQLENFQKKLWLKKKFVTATNYCISLDRIDAEFYSEIVKNTQQHDEWLKLFAIDELPNYSKPLTVDFLKQNTNLVLDTVFFPEDFTVKLLATIDNFDEQCDGLLVHSENFQALNLLQERYYEQVKCVYIDPPFNLGQNGDFLYKTDYLNSSWLTLLQNRIKKSYSLISNKGSFFARCDYNGNYLLRNLLDDLFYNSHINELIIKSTEKVFSGLSKYNIAVNTLFFYAKDKKHHGFYAQTVKRANKDIKWQGAHSGGERFPPERTFENKILLPPKGRHWTFIQDKIDKLILKKRFRINADKSYIDLNGNKIQGMPEYLLSENKLLTSNWTDISGYSSTTGFSTENAEILLQRIIQTSTIENDLVLDFFMGSATTQAVAHKLKRKWIGVEFGNQFYDYDLPRLKKVLFGIKNGISKNIDYKNGGCFKYIRLESYEDTLNNLEFKDDVSQQLKNNKLLHTDYMLNYVLDIDTNGSQSLLNIDKFKEPTNYKLKIKQPNTDQLQEQKIDLIETFNYLIGLRLINMAAPQSYDAKFKYAVDEDLPEDQQEKLIIDGKIKSTTNGKWWFRVIEGTKPQDKFKPNESKQLQVLIIWRKLTGDLVKDNLMLDEFFNKRNINTKDKEYDIIYVNGSHNLDNLKQEQDHWKVRLIEEEFHKQMWNIEGAV